MIHETAIIESCSVAEDADVWAFTHIRENVVICREVSIGANVYIGPNVTIGQGTRIQNNVYIPEGVVIGKHCFIGPGVIFTNDKYPPSPKEDWECIYVEPNVSIGAGAIILPGITLKEGAKIGAGSVVTHTVYAHQPVYGNPARYHPSKHGHDVGREAALKELVQNAADHQKTL